MNIQEMRTKPHLSASAIAEYIECGLAFKFGRIDGVEPEFHPAQMSLGSAIHSALGAFYRSMRNGREMDLDRLLDEFSNFWAAEAGRGDLRPKNGDTPESFSKPGSGC